MRTENNTAETYRKNNKKTATSSTFEYKIKIIGSKQADNNTLDTENVASLKYLRKFCRYQICLQSNEKQGLIWESFG